MRWLRHNCKTPCPVCQQTHKGCRTNTETNITHCRGDDPSPEYRFLKQDKHGFSMFKHEAEIEEFSEQKKQEQLEEKRRLERKEKQRQWEKHLKNQLSPEQRDRAIRQIISQLPLTKEDRAKLQARGLTNEQIKYAGYFSLTHQWQKLEKRVNPALAGVNRYGTGLVNFDTGIGTPIPDEDGYFVGFQYRRENPDDGNKYPWSASETSRENRPTVHNKDGELPLGVWGSPNDDGTVYLCESPGIKPFIASLRLNAPVIGAAGNNFASSPKALYRALTKLQAKKIVIVPDGGAIINSHIHKQIEQVIDLLSEWGYQDVSIAWWGQIEKDSGDIDEISEQTLAAIEYLSTTRYFKKAKELQRDRRQWETKKKLTKLSGVDKRVHKPYFEPEDLNDIPKDCSLVYVVGSQGTGKSVLGKKMARRNRFIGNPTFGTSHRRLLSRSTARDWSQKGDYVPFVEDEGGAYNQYGFTFVINSMHLESQAMFSPDDSRLKGAFILFDEFDQILDALFMDSTMEHRRALIAANLAKTIQNVVISGGTCVFASADIYDFHKEFINDIFKRTYDFEPKSYTLVNDYNPVAEAGCELEFYDDPKLDDSPARLYADTVELIKENNKILLQTTSQSVDSPYGTQTLESDLRKRFPELRILRWDSETNRDPNHEAFGFAEKLKQDSTIIENYDVIIMSPVAETGIDIKDPNKHFDYNVGIANSGNQDSRAIRQTLRRLRQLVPRKVFVAPRSNAKIGTGKITPRGILQDNSRQLTKLKGVLLSAGVTDDEDEFDLGDNQDFQIFLKPWAYSAALKNIDFADYRKSAREALEAEGYFIESTTDLKEMIGFTPTSAADTKKQLQKTRDENKEAHYQAVADKPDPDDERYEQLQNKNDKTADEQIEEEKGFLTRAYNVEVSYRLIEKHNEGNKDWLQKLKLHYHLTEGAEFLPKKERAMLESLTEGTGRAFSPEVVRKSRALKIHWLKEFGIDRFLDQSSNFEEGLCTDSEFTEDELKAWYDSIIEKSRELKESLGISIWGKNKSGQWEKVKPKTLADRLLDLVDLGLQSFRRRNDNGDRRRVYKVARIAKAKDSDLLELKSKIFAAWLEKDKATNQERDTSHYSLGTVPKSHNNITTPTSNFRTENNTTSTGNQSQTPLTDKGIKTKAKELSLILNNETINSFKQVYSAIEAFGKHWGDEACEALIQWLKHFSPPEIAEVLQ